MRKPRKTAVVAVLLSAIGFLGAGTAYADGHGHGHGQKHEQKHGKKHGKKHGHKHRGKETKAQASQTLLISQSTTCSTTEENIDVQGQYGYQNGLQGNQYNGTGSPGTQTTTLGSSQGCNNTVVLGK
ncbi:hypothetical protein [Streptomyces sp. AS02]|uniref:hypothetical protein n=1 Tax=Streptomyces sp. AS02 TaxID=2938946 RepID=UPI002020C000|nr:hypothetical protein [Streptomyces sp. AS02]MCL8013983.1 hypothetical protein [Streptomyces sp. AS02]